MRVPLLGCPNSILDQVNAQLDDSKHLHHDFICGRPLLTGLKVPKVSSLAPQASGGQHTDLLSKSLLALLLLALLTKQHIPGVVLSVMLTAFTCTTGANRLSLAQAFTCNLLLTCHMLGCSWLLKAGLLLSGGQAGQMCTA